MNEGGSPSFCALAFVGPGEAERERLQRLCAGIFRNEPGVRRIVLIDDASQLEFGDFLPSEVMERLVVLPNPRNQEGNWWQGGLCTALAEGLGWIARNENVDFAVRLDTDAHVFNPFAERITRRFREDPRTGVLGTWMHYPLKEDTHRLPHPGTTECMQAIIPKLTHPLTIWRETNVPTYFQRFWSKDDRTVARLARRAMANGYRCGDFVQGGGYAVRGELLKAALRYGFFHHSRAYLRVKFGEDHLATLFSYGCGFGVDDFNRPGEVFAVQGYGLPAAPAELRSMGFAIAHSIKNDPELSEAELCARLDGTA